MLIRMRAKIMAVRDQIMDQFVIFGIAIKIPGEEKARSNIFLPQNSSNMISPIIIVAAGEDERKAALSSIPSDHAAIAEKERPWPRFRIGGRQRHECNGTEVVRRRARSKIL